MKPGTRNARRNVLMNLSYLARTGTNGNRSVSDAQRRIDAHKFAAQMGEAENIKFLLASAISLPYASSQYSLVFMDPPYYNQFVGKTLSSLIKNQWLKNGAIIAVEMERREDLDLPTEIHLMKEKIYGNNKLLILRYEQE